MTSPSEVYSTFSKNKRKPSIAYDKTFQKSDFMSTQIDNFRKKTSKSPFNIRVKYETLD